MHPQSPQLTIGGTVLKESDEYDILGVIFNSKMPFEKHLRSDSRAASQRLGILTKPWRVFQDRLLLGRRFRGFILPVLEYCSAVWCSAVDTHLKLLDRSVSDARFLTGGVFECDIVHRRSVAVLCILYNISSNPMNPLFGAEPGKYVPLRVTRGALIAHLYTQATPRCINLRKSRTFIPLSVYLCGTILVTPYSMVLGCRVSRAWPMRFYWRSCSLPFCLLLFSLSLLSLYGAGVFGMIGC